MISSPPLLWQPLPTVGRFATHRPPRLPSPRGAGPSCLFSIRAHDVPLSAPTGTSPLPESSNVLSKHEALPGRIPTPSPCRAHEACPFCPSFARTRDTAGPFQWLSLPHQGQPSSFDGGWTPPLQLEQSDARTPSAANFIMISGMAARRPWRRSLSPSPPSLPHMHMIPMLWSLSHSSYDETLAVRNKPAQRISCLQKVCLPSCGGAGDGPRPVV